MAKHHVKWSDFHSLTESTVINHVPDKSGIYILWVEVKGEKWRCIFVGQAQDIRTGLLQHMTNNEENERLKENVKEFVCGFQYALVEKQSDKDGMEKYLYEYNNPECNNTPPDVKQIEINIP